jgi:molybdenum cofactor cytidylyltransferase
MHHSTILEALGIVKGDIVALVGGGGKTTVMFRLASEATSCGWKTITTTTTNISVPSKSQSQMLVVKESSRDLKADVLMGLRSLGHVTVVGSRIRDDKLHGLEPEEVVELARATGADLVLVEADGARRRPLKVPAEHEPVIPEGATKVLVLVGADALNVPLSVDTVHRIESFMALTGLKEGELVTPEIVAHAVTHHEGGMKGIPERASVWIVLNKVNMVDRALALDFAHRALMRERIVGVLLLSWDRIETVERRFVSVVLAAGQGARFGGAKQLAEFRGMPMVRRAAEVLLNSEVGRIVAVVGHRADDVKEALKGLPVQCIFNPHWAEGLATSIRVGLGALGEDTEGVLFFLADQPTVRSETVDKLLKAFREHRGSIVVPVFRGRRGNPALFPKGFFRELSSLKGDVGGREIIKRWPEAVLEVPVEDPGVLLDVDRPEDMVNLADSP